MQKIKNLLTTMLLLLMAGIVLAQEKSVSGTVSDLSNGESIPGVNVLVKGTSSGVITDIEGNYIINVPQDGAILVFSFIGFKTQEIPIGNRNQIDVLLETDLQSLDEVVVVGYGTQKRSDLTGSIIRIDMEGKEMAANVTLFQALQGNTPGVNVGGGGLAGAEPSISIRGQTSLSASNNPLIVVDGIIYNGALSDININDVQSIDVLKDASAAAVYGSRSANGVMIITTKKGKTDKPLFNFNMYQGVQSMTKNPMRVMNAEQYAIRLVDYYYQQGLYTWYRTNPTEASGRPVRPDITDRNIVAQRLRTQEEKDNYLAGNEIDWVDEVMRVAPIHNYSLSISGKTDNTNYFLSGSYTDQEGIMRNDKFQRSTLRANFENKITDWLSIGLNSSFSTLDYSGVPTSLNNARRVSPLANMFDDSGNYPMYLTGESYMPHPFEVFEIDDVDIHHTLFNILYAKINIPKIKGLTYEFNYSSTFNTRNNKTFFPSTISQGAANLGRAVKYHAEERSEIINNIISYQGTLADDHFLNGTLLYSWERRRGEHSRTQAEGFDNEILRYNAMEIGTILTAESGAWEESSLSYMARINYSFKNRYLITGTIRRDGFSGFGANKKFATFPSLSLGWVASEEAFLNNVVWLDFLKLRTSFGLNGNQGIGRYSSFSHMGSNAYVYGSNTAVGLYPNSLGNADLGWESTKSFNIGLDYSVLDERISGQIDVYNSNTTDVLVSRAIPEISGYSSVWANIGGINNKGIDLGLSTLNIDGALRWETRFIFSLNRDKITKLYGGENDQDIGNSWFVGEPISAIYDYKAAGGVWTEDEFFNGEVIPGWYPGQFRLVDLDNDNMIEPTRDRTVIGYQTPNYRFGVNSALFYKNFTFSFFINSIQGGNGYYLSNNASSVIVPYRSDDVYRINLTATRQYWTPENGVNNAVGVYNTPQREVGVYEDRSFVRLQDISLNYQFDNLKLHTLGVDGLQLYVSGKNLYTWTKWSGWDPENISEIPMIKSIIAGLKLNF